MRLLNKLLFPLVTLCTLLSAVPLRAQEPQADSTAQRDERPLTINEKRRQRGLTDVNTLCVPKGQWIFGGTASYSTHTNEGYQFLVIDKIDSKGYTFKVSPLIAYAFHNNMALGGRFIYSRSLLKLDNAKLSLGDEDSGIDITARDFYSIRHTYTVAPEGAHTEAKFAYESPVKGTYETGYTLSLGVSPGIIAFATNNMAVEVNVGVMGITYTSTEQVHNQVRVGKRSTSMMNFKVNIFSIGLGMYFYL